MDESLCSCRIWAAGVSGEGQLLRKRAEQESQEPQSVLQSVVMETSG